MASLSSVIQGLLVAQLPEYEISNDAIGYLCNFSEKLLIHLVKAAENYQKPLPGSLNLISYKDIEKAICDSLSSEWSTSIIRKASLKLIAPPPEEKDSSLKQEISDFEFIDDGNAVPVIEHKAAGNLFLSADFIKSFLSPTVTPRLDTDACIYLSVCMEDVLSEFIEQARIALQHPIVNEGGSQMVTGELVITQLALETAAKVDEKLRLLACLLFPDRGVPATDEEDVEIIPGFDPVEDDTIQEHEGDAQEVNDDSSNISEAHTQQSSESHTHQSSELQQSLLQLSSTEDQLDVQQSNNQSYESVAQTSSQLDSQLESQLDLQQSDSQLVAQSEPHRDSQHESFLDSQPTISQDANAPLSQDANALLSGSKSSKLSTLANASETVELTPVALSPPSPRNVAKVRKPIFELYGKCCPYVDISTLAIQLLSSIMELFIRNLLSETKRFAGPHTRVLRQHVREVASRLMTFQCQIMEDVSRPDSNSFQECVRDSVKNQSFSEWETELDPYVADVLLLVSSRLLLVASAHARMAGLWIINSPHIAAASTQLFSGLSVIPKFVQKTVRDNMHEGEGATLSPPVAPRIRAAEMIYLTSIIRETPLQLDNQLLVIFVFLVTLSIHTICCVR